MKLAIKEERKAKAIAVMQQLNIYKPYIEGFEQNNHVCLFEGYAGFGAFQYPELEAKIKEIEEKHGCTVYAITHEFTEFGELYDFLTIPKYKADWKNIIYSNRNEHTAFAYVWNKSDEWCSEFGDIGVQSAFGGIRRIA